MQSLAVMWQWDCPQSVSYPYGGDEAHCAIGAPWHSAKTRGIIWGDGHAQHFAPLLDKPAQDRSISLLLFPGICLPIITKDSVQRHFPSSLSTINSGLSGAVGYYRFSELTKINLLVLAAAWQHYPVELYVNDSPRSRELGVELMRTGRSAAPRDKSARIAHHRSFRCRVAAERRHWMYHGHERRDPAARLTSNIFETPRERVENAHAATNAIIRALPEPWPNVSALVGEAPCERPDGEAL